MRERPAVPATLYGISIILRGLHKGHTWLGEVSHQILQKIRFYNGVSIHYADDLRDWSRLP